MLPSLTHAPGESEGKDVGEKGGSPSSYPPSHSKVWGRGATSSASEGGSEREGHLPKVTQHSRDRNPDTGPPKVRAVTVELR